MRGEFYILDAESDIILFFVKFGRRKWMQRLMQGKMYFSNVECFRAIEKETGKGRGDAFEAMLRFSLPNSTTLNTDIDSTPNMPVFCITAVRKNECNIQEVNNKHKITINTDLQEKVRNDFKDADTAVVFWEPQKLIKSIGNTATAVYGAIHYFDLSMEHQDYAFHEYLVRNAGIISKSNPMILSTQFKELNGTFHPKQYITKRNAHRILFCKDLFFAGEREYRFVFTNKQIQKPEEFVVRYGQQKRTILTLDDFFSKGITI
jgi:hypothetical protein